MPWGEQIARVTSTVKNRSQCFYALDEEGHYEQAVAQRGINFSQWLLSMLTSPQQFTEPARALGFGADWPGHRNRCRSAAKFDADVGQCEGSSLRLGHCDEAISALVGGTILADVLQVSAAARRRHGARDWR